MAEPRIAPVVAPETDADTQELLAGLAGGRSEALNIFTTLAHHPKLLKKWSQFGGALLYRGELPAREREILILRTGWNCRSDYEWGQHKAIGVAVGLTEAEVDATTKPATEGGWDEGDVVLITAADELHEHSTLDDRTWEALAARYDNKQLIEILMTVGQYHLVSMTLNALRVQRDDGVEGFPVVSGRLENRRVVVVGAGTRASADPDAPVGNGRAIALLAAREGASVACVDADTDAAAATAALVEAEGAKAAVITADVRDPAACDALVAESVAALGGIDGVVLNVGVGAGVGLKNTTVEDWDLVSNVNLRSHFLVAKAAKPHLGEGAAIVFISSVAGLQAGSHVPAYDTTKAALLGLGRHVAAEGASRGVRANVVCPGLIDTPLGRAASGGRPSRDRTPVPLGRQGTAWEVAAPVVFLLSDEASYITGQVLVVDGGLFMR